MKDSYKLLLILFCYIAAIYALTASFIIWP